MSELHRHQPRYYADPKPRPSLAELWQLWRTQSDQAAKRAEEDNRYDPTQTGSIPVDRVNAYHESLLEPEIKIERI